MLYWFSMYHEALRLPNLARMRRAPTHPGEVFEEEYRKPMGISQAEAARRMGMSANRLNEIVKGKRHLTVESAAAFAKLTKTSHEFWWRLNADHVLWGFLHEH